MFLPSAIVIVTASHNMPAVHKKFNSSWLSHVDPNGQTVGEWCRKGKHCFHAYCRFCYTDFKCDNSGKFQVLQHAKKEKHKQAIKHVLKNNQCKLMVIAGIPLTSSSTSFNYNDASLVAEIYWLAKIASCNFSLKSNLLFTMHFDETTTVQVKK